VSVWEKMMKLLEPGGLSPSPNIVDFLEVLPFYDKYQLSAGLRICEVFCRTYRPPYWIQRLSCGFHMVVKTMYR
jgi:hypothetical protein